MVNGRLDQNVPVHLFFTDKFDHVYHEEVTTDSSGSFTVYASWFPPGYFNPYMGQLIMEIKEGIGYCAPLQITACEQSYDKIVIEFKNGELPAQIPCEC